MSQKFSQPPDVDSNVTFGGEGMTGVESAITVADSRFTPKITTAQGRIRFVDEKPIDWGRVQRFLEPAAHHGMWSNRGPAWHAACQAFAEHMGLRKGQWVVPVANGGIALEALAGLLSVKHGGEMRWAVSAFGFANSNRGLFAAAQIVDCNLNGILDVDLIDPNTVDGILVTNVFGLRDDFKHEIAWALRHGKKILIDNAAGLGPQPPNAPYQSFSLHHTKPYGIGEGGLMMLPEDDVEPALRLLEYTQISPLEAKFWVNNGKISEVSVALHLERLEKVNAWRPKFIEQAKKVEEAARLEGLVPFYDGEAVATSVPVLAPGTVPPSAIQISEITLGKYYKPLAPRPIANKLYDRILNVPSHPDMAVVDKDDLRMMFRDVLARSTAQNEGKSSS